MEAIRRWLMGGTGSEPVGVEDESLASPIQIAIQTAGEISVGDLFGSESRGLKPGISISISDTIELTYIEVIVERFNTPPSQRNAVRNRIRLAASIDERADIPYLADWLVENLQGDPEAMISIEGTTVEAESKELITKLTSEYEAHQ